MMRYTVLGLSFFLGLMPNISQAQTGKYIPFEYSLDRNIASHTLPLNLKPLSETEDIKVASILKPTPQFKAPTPSKKPVEAIEQAIATKVSLIEPAVGVARPILEPTQEQEYVEPAFWRVVLAPKISDLTPRAVEELKNKIIPTLRGTGNSKILLQSFAAPHSYPGADRRTALARLLETRDILIANDVDPNRIDIKVHGAETDIKPMDRIDIYLNPQDK